MLCPVGKHEQAKVARDGAPLGREVVPAPEARLDLRGLGRSGRHLRDRDRSPEAGQRHDGQEREEQDEKRHAADPAPREEGEIVGDHREGEGEGDLLREGGGQGAREGACLEEGRAPVESEAAAGSGRGAGALRRRRGPSST